MPAGIVRHVSELLGDAQQLIVLRDTLTARRAAGLDLADAGRHREVRDEGVFGLPRAVRDHRAVAVAPRQLDALQRLRKCADLVHLDEDRVRDALFDAPGQALDVGAEEIVAMIASSAASSFGRSGAKPPSSPTAVESPRLANTFFSAWNTSTPMRRPSGKVSAPIGTTMNSWESTVFAACAPPFRMFIIGTGSTWATGPPR